MKGFTLIETIITIFVFTLTMGAIAGFIVMGYRTQGYAFQQSQAINEARRGIETMVKEIREARTAEDGSYVINGTQDNEFSFYSDVDKDEKIEKVRYFLEGTDFKKGIIEPQGAPAVYPAEGEEVIILSQYVRNSPPIFRYFDGDGQELSSPVRKKDTKLMRVYLIININPDRAPQDYELSSEAQIRNLKTNL